MIFLYYYYCYSSLKLVGINQSCIYRLLNHTNWRSWKHARLRAWIWFLTHNLAALIPGGKPNSFTGYQSGRTRNQICLVTLRELFTCTKITDYIVCCLEYHWSVEIPWGERSPDKAVTLLNKLEAISSTFASCRKAVGFCQGTDVLPAIHQP